VNVAVLQKHLSDLTQTLREAGATKPVLDGLTATANSLIPFADMKVEAFADFLVLVKGYKDAGVGPDQAPKRRGSTRPAAEKVKGPAPDEVIGRVVRLYREVLTASAEHIEQELKLIDGLTGPNLVKAAEQIGVRGLLKGRVAEQKAALKKAILDNKGMAERTTH
jgi:hypothetical protein